MAEYVEGPDGIVHLIAPWVGGGFTFCDRDHVEEDSGGFAGKPHEGPATCSDCHCAVKELRRAISGARWRGCS